MNELETVFKALSDTNRIQIITLLRGREICACKLLNLLDISQSTLSHHMKILVNAKLVKVRKCGKWAHYSINNEGFDLIKEFLNIAL